LCGAVMGSSIFPDVVDGECPLSTTHVAYRTELNRNYFFGNQVARNMLLI